MMADIKEQRVCVKFCFLLGKSVAEIVLMLQEAFKEEALSRTQVYEWYSHFKGGEMLCEDQPRTGRPSTCRKDGNFDMISIYLLTTIGLSAGGSSTAHIYTQTIHRTTQNKQYIEQHNNVGECGPCPVLLVHILIYYNKKDPAYCLYIF